MSEYAGIVEVVKTNTHTANVLLAAGYRLLDVQPEAEANYGRGGGGHFWVERWVAYVLGRPADVEHVDVSSVRRHRINTVIMPVDPIEAEGAAVPA